MTLTSIAIMALFLAPSVANAEWRSYGSYEPDTSVDDPQLMWTTPPGTTKNRIYFNAYATWGVPTANGGIINPNVGALNTAFDLPGPTYWEAVLGVWTDCNGDGYIGMAETAVREYRNEVLLNKDLCPPTSGTPANWNGQNNYNNWVVELIPIGNRETTLGDRRLFKDDEAMVWGDFGKPDSPPSVATCNTNFARGQTQSTGGLISYADCQGSRGIATSWNSVARDGRLIYDPNTSQSGDEIFLPGLAPGFAFNDPNRPQDSTSPLNRPTFGSEDTQYAPVHVFDCSRPYILRSGDVLNQTPLGPATRGVNGDDRVHKIHVRPVDVRPGNLASPSAPAMLNETNESVFDDCNTQNDRGADFYEPLEGDFQGTNIPKTKSNWNFLFDNADRGTLPGTVLGSGSAGSATDFGIELLGTGCLASGCVQTAWGADSYQVYVPPTVTYTTRVDVAAPGSTQVDTDIANASYFTFYAYVSGAVTQRGAGYKTPGGSGTYGFDQCGANTSGIHNGWECNKNKWYILPSGEPTPEAVKLARPGQPYNLRDTDCFDGRAYSRDLDAEVGIEPAYYGDNPCAR